MSTYNFYSKIYNLGLAPGSFVGDIHRFRRVDRSGFNRLDQPDQRFFKLLFYFCNDNDGDSFSSDFYNGGWQGLLAPTWNEPGIDNKSYYKYNSAWAYLMNNNEVERANTLREFITLLSQVSSQSPWYFQEVTGVDEALAREKFMIGEERKKISIKCLVDPIDRRIENLLSMYRSIVWSHARKCEVIPANLRKFDMGLFVYSGAVQGVNFFKDSKNMGFANLADTKLSDLIQMGGTPENIAWSDINISGEKSWPNKPAADPNESAEERRLKEMNWMASIPADYKYVEFHNCEISIDSIKSGYGSLNNAEGFDQEFTIDIYFDDCYENEFNRNLMTWFGDFFVWDTWVAQRNDNGETVTPAVDVIGRADDDPTESSTGTSVWDSLKDNLSERWDILKRQATNAFNGALDDVKSSALSVVTGGLGNFYGQGGGINGALDSVQSELSSQMKSLQSKVIGNINNMTTNISRSATNTLTAPVKGNIKTLGKIADTVVESADNVIAKPVLGTMKAAETAVVRGVDAGLSYVNETGDYVSNESKKIGNIAYDSQVRAANTIGQNRLNAKLGNMNK